MTHLERALAQIEKGTPAVEPAPDEKVMVPSMRRPAGPFKSPGPRTRNRHKRQTCATPGCKRETRTDMSYYCASCLSDRRRDARGRYKARVEAKMPRVRRVYAAPKVPRFMQLTGEMVDQVFDYVRRVDCAMSELDITTAYRHHGWSGAITMRDRVGKSRIPVAVWDRFVTLAQE